VLDCDRE
jgi:hypothetical protein